MIANTLIRKSSIYHWVHLLFKRGVESIGLALLMYGLILASACLDGNLSSLGRLFVFHPHTQEILRDGFLAIFVGTYGILLMGDVLARLSGAIDNSRTWKFWVQLLDDKVTVPLNRLAARHPHRFGAFVSILTGAIIACLAIMPTPKSSQVPIPVARVRTTPVDRVLLHMEGRVKDHKNLLWKTNIEGTAQVKPLGNHRYLVLLN